MATVIPGTFNVQLSEDDYRYELARWKQIAAYMAFRYSAQLTSVNRGTIEFDQLKKAMNETIRVFKLLLDSLVCPHGYHPYTTDLDEARDIVEQVSEMCEHNIEKKD